MYNKSNDSFGTLPNYPNMPVCLPSGGWSPAAVIHTVSPPALSPAATVWTDAHPQPCCTSSPVYLSVTYNVH